jgi:hypothetical protein
MVLAGTIIAIIAVELFMRMPVVPTANRLIYLMPKALRIIRSSKISDHWKEKVLLRYSRDMAVITLKITFFIVCIGLAVVAISFAFDQIIAGDTTTLEYLSTWQGLSIATAASIAYYLARSRFV